MKDFFSKREPIRRKLQVCSYLPRSLNWKTSFFKSISRAIKFYTQNKVHILFIENYLYMYKY